MENKPIVSIIVPVYKCEKYIEKCIESILHQSCTNIELILVLDGIFDKSDEICDKYAAFDPRVIVVKKQNEGVSVARNVGLEKASGIWIAFVDGDDWLDENYLSCMLLAADYNSDIVICDYIAEYRNTSIKEKFFVYEDYNFTKDEINDVIKNCLLPYGCGNTGACTNVGVPWSKIYKTEFINKHNIRFKPGLSRMQDMVFNLYALSYASNIKYIGKNLYHYLRNEGSSTCVFRPAFANTVCDINKAVHEFAIKQNKKEVIEWMYAKNILLIIEIIKLQYVLDTSHRTMEKIIQIRKKIKKEPFRMSLKKFDMNMLNFKPKLAGILLKHGLVGITYVYIRLKTWKEQNNLDI